MTNLTNEQIEQILEGHGVRSGSLGSVVVDCDNDPIEYTDEYSTYNLNLLREILSLRQEVGRIEEELSLAIEIIEDSGIDYNEVVEAKEQDHE